MKQKVTDLLMETWNIVSSLVVCNVIDFVMKYIMLPFGWDYVCISLIKLVKFQMLLGIRVIVILSHI